jgi:hypothetical protein
MLSLAGVALQIVVTVAAPETLTVRQPATITVRAVVRGPVAPTIHPPRFAPLSGIRVEESTSLNGSTMSRAAVAAVEHKYLVVAQRPGVVVLPPIEANVGPMTGRSDPVRLTIVNAPPVQVPAIVSRSRLDPSNGVNFHALVTPDTVYVGEQATYQVGVFLNDDVRYRLRRNPEFIPPELRSMLAYDLSAPRSFSKRVIDGRHYEVHVFQRALFPLTAGRYEIPAARLNYSLPLSASFFSREESHQLRSEVVPLVVVEPPQAGRPADYTGAVGRLALEAHVDSVAAKVGDPLVLTVRVTGDGNVSFFPRPEVRVPWGQLVRAEERVQLDSSAAIVRGAKEFDWVITPARSGEVEVPAIRYPYFNPYTERYELAVTSPQRLSVAPGQLIAVDATADSTRPVFPLRRIMLASPEPPVSQSRAFWLTMLIAPFPAALALVVRRPRTRRIPTASERLRKLARGRNAATASDAATLRRTYAAALAERIGVAAAELADRRALVRALRRSGVTAEVASAADELLGELDSTVYSGSGTSLEDGVNRAVDVLRQVDHEARPRIVPRASARSFGAVAVLGLTLGVAQSQPTARESFDHGAREYEARRFARAERFFAEAARAVPTSPDAWANFGTAAWAARDTAAAAIGWQRALRLDPLSGDARSRLDLTPGFGGSALASVPPVTESSVAVLGGSAWVLGWLFAAVGIWRRRAGWRYAAYTLGIVAVGSAVVGVRVREAFEARRLAVVVDAGRLRSLPVLGGEPGAPVLTGEVARTVREEGVWSLVRLGDDREGWLETDHLEPISRPWASGRR